MYSLDVKSIKPLVLLTGFNAFGGDTHNPSWLAAKALNGRIIENHCVLAAQLPTEFKASGKQLTALLRKHKPALVICLGLAAGRAGLSLERIAINVQDARIADNAGAQPVDRPIVKNGPAAYFSSLPIKAMLQVITETGVPAEVSQTAGTFVCNHVFYTLMHLLKKDSRALKVRGGFVHIPCLPSDAPADWPCLPLEDIVRGLHAAIACAVTTQMDIALSAGALS